MPTDRGEWDKKRGDHRLPCRKLEESPWEANPASFSLHGALHEAGKHRTRPILMSTLAAILTLLPLALALGHGSQMQQPLAVAIISGMLLQLPLVLLVMPVLYSLLRRRDKATSGQDANDPAPAG